MAPNWPAAVRSVCIVLVFSEFLFAVCHVFCASDKICIVLNKPIFVDKDSDVHRYIYGCFCLRNDGYCLVVPEYNAACVCNMNCTRTISRRRLFGAPRLYYSHGTQCFHFYNLYKDGDIELNPGPHGHVNFVPGRQPAINERANERAIGCSNPVYSSVTPTHQRRQPVQSADCQLRYSSVYLKKLRRLRVQLPQQVLLYVQQLNVRRHRGCRAGQRRKKDIPDLTLLIVIQAESRTFRWRARRALLHLSRLLVLRLVCCYRRSRHRFRQLLQFSRSRR